MFKKLLFTFLCLYCVIAVFGQSLRQPQYETHAIFVKTHDFLNVQLPQIRFVNGEVVGNAENMALWEANDDLQLLVKQLGITAITHPFQTRSHRLNRTYQISFSDAAQIDNIISVWKAQSYIEYAEKIPVYEIDYIPNDYTASQQYYIGKIQAQNTWDLTKGDTNVVIAVIDAAVMTGHPDLEANMFHNWKEEGGTAGVDDDGNGYIDDVMGWDAANGDNNPNPGVIANFDHGTHVAGCASAVADNNLGVAGVGFSCRILPIKAKADGSTGPSLGATLAGFDYAVACGYTDVINMSFGGAGSQSSVWQDLIDVAYQQGIVVVASAGNDNTLATNYFPASYNHVICVGSSNQNDGKSWFSNYGPTIDVMAPGSGIKSTIPVSLNPIVGGYASWDGTSMSGPIVAGIVGLMLSVNPLLGPDAIENCLKQACDNINAQNSGYIGQIGAGRVNAYNAVQCVTPTVAPTPLFTYSTTTSCNGVINFTNQSQNLPVTWSWNFGNGQTANVPNPTIAFGASGTYNVSLTVGNAIGSNTLTQTVIVNALPVPAVTIGTSSVDLCNAQPLSLNATTSLPGTILWSPSTGVSSTNTLSTVITTNQSRTYTLTVTGANGCAGTDTVRVNVRPVPTVYAGADVSIAQGGSTQLNPLTSSNVTYLWSPGSSLSDSLIKNPIATPAATTDYTLTVTNVYGCQKSDVVKVMVDGTSSIDVSQIGQIAAISPNPVSAIVTFSVSLKAETNVQLQIWDVTGRKVHSIVDYSLATGTHIFDWNTTGVAAGVYVAKWSLNGKTYTQKFVKE